MLLTVRRAGEVLDLFRSQGEWGVSAVAAELGVAKSQAHELLTSLCSIGLVRRSGHGRYRLGWGTVSLGDELLRREFRGRRALSVRRLAAATCQSAHLVALDRARVVILAGSRGKDGGCADPGLSADRLHCTAAGKLLLATQGASVVGSLLCEGLRAFTPQTIASADELRRHLAEIAERGLAFDCGESDVRRRAVAAPVMAQDGSVLAVLTLTTTDERWRTHEREYTILARREAALLSRDLRHGADSADEALERRAA
jgi:DNA-binding IclR family transcriptional regulator